MNFTSRVTTAGAPQRTGSPPARLETAAEVAGTITGPPATGTLSVWVPGALIYERKRLGAERRGVMEVSQRTAAGTRCTLGVMNKIRGGTRINNERSALNSEAARACTCVCV